MTDCPIKIRAANGGILESTHIGEISVPHLPTQSCSVHDIPGLASMSLLAMGPLCDAGWSVEFTATTAEVKLRDNLVLQGNRTPPGLWIFQLPTNDSPVLPDDNSMLPQMNSAIGAPKAAEQCRMCTHMRHCFHLQFLPWNRLSGVDTFETSPVSPPRHYNTIRPVPLLLLKDTWIKFDKIFARLE
jgi:hypothetical protein